jgi:hypothetical protein
MVAYGNDKSAMGTKQLEYRCPFFVFTDYVVQYTEGAFANTCNISHLKLK